MSIPKGALVSQVIPNSPAEKAGLQIKDVIVEFNKEEIIYSGDLPQTVGSIRPGSKVNAKIIRNGSAMQIKVEVGELPANLSIASSTIENQSNDLGVVVRGLTSEEKKAEQITYGVVITGIDPEGIAIKQGFQVGDIIVEIGNDKIRTSRNLSNAIEKAKQSESIGKEN